VTDSPREEPRPDRLTVLFVTGDREWTDHGALQGAIAPHRHRARWLLHGGCRGADSVAHAVALEVGIQPIRMDAMWTFYGKKAGPLRNAEMGRLLAALQAVGYEIVPLVCHDHLEGSRGTANMVEVLEHHGLEWTHLWSAQHTREGE
jgi:hypothetical protein